MRAPSKLSFWNGNDIELLFSVAMRIVLSELQVDSLWAKEREMKGPGMEKGGRLLYCIAFVYRRIIAAASL